VVLDGVFTETDTDVRFHEATHFSADDKPADFLEGLPPVSDHG
jgi:hypothetical protein